MDLFNILSLIGGLCLFLFGMNLMGSALEKRAGNGMKTLLAKLTTNRFAGLLTGLGVTAVIQSSSATTVMVVGFVNSALMTLRQGIHVIMGANIGTTVTSWILSLSGIESSNVFVKLLKPASFTPILALIGIIFYMFFHSAKKKDTGTILLGFATLMFGMEAMSGAVSGLKEIPEFQNLMILFSNPILGVLVGAVMTAVIQSSSASVGILQALASTGKVTFGSAIPIIMGQNIGTCITAMISSVGTNRNAKRVASVHLLFNVLGTAVWLTVYCILDLFLNFAFADAPVNGMGIAIIHTIFNVLCTILMLPLTGLLEKLACKMIPDKKTEQQAIVLDERLMMTPAIALERCHVVTMEMAELSVDAMQKSLGLLQQYDKKTAAQIQKAEERADQYEDTLGEYLVSLNSHPMTERDGMVASKLLRIIHNFERISDHSVKIQQLCEKLQEEKMQFSENAHRELQIYQDAVKHILTLTQESFRTLSEESAKDIEPLERVINKLEYQLHDRHIQRLQKGGCSVEAGFLWNELISELERAADRCSGIAECLIEMKHFDKAQPYAHKAHANTPLYQELERQYTMQYALPSFQNSNTMG